jgi:hypothetical protein
MSDDDEKVMVCAVCGRVLDRRQRWPQWDKTEYEHTAQDRDAEADHPAVAVPQRRNDVSRPRCDFCNADQVQGSLWIVPATSFEMPGMPGNFSDGDWAACDDCASYIRENKWDGLVRYVCTLRATPAYMNLVTALYQTLQRHITGLPYKEPA